MIWGFPSSILNESARVSAHATIPNEAHTLSHTHDTQFMQSLHIDIHHWQHRLITSAGKLQIQDDDEEEEEKITIALNT